MAGLRVGQGEVWSHRGEGQAVRSGSPAGFRYLSWLWQMDETVQAIEDWESF
jgi:hypothetical protein